VRESKRNILTAKVNSTRALSSRLHKYNTRDRIQRRITGLNELNALGKTRLNVSKLKNALMPEFIQSGYSIRLLYLKRI
jgi:hypothetical protein